MRQFEGGSSSPPVDPAGSAGSDPFRSLLPVLCGVCAATHVAFVVLFVFVGEQVMAAVNVVSVGWYAMVFILVRRARTKPIVEFSLVAVEVLGHAVLATAFLGWDSGFHYYVLLMVPVTAVSTIRPPRLKSAAVASTCLAYLGLDLWLRSGTPPHRLPAEPLQYLYYFNVLSALMVLAMLAGRYYLLISQAQTALRVMATTDPLTQLANRASITETIRQQQARASRGHPVSFAMCDIDHFKQINDQGGHSAGDDVLRAVSRSMTASIRGSDIIGRWGGEEFLVVLPDAGAVEATTIAERLREDVASLALPIAGRLSQVTVTIGVATMRDGEEAATTIARADTALYEGKRSGRNRVTVATDAVLTEAAPTTP